MSRSKMLVLAAAAILIGGSALAGNVTTKFDMDLYGYLKLEGVYDTQRTVDGDIMLWVLPKGADGKDDEFNMTAMESRFGFNIKGPDAGTAKTSGKLEAGFYGRVNAKGNDGKAPAHKPLLRLRLAYADLIYETWSFRFGQDWDAFMTLVPKAVNFTYFGEQGAPGYRRAQVRATKLMGTGDTKLKAVVAAARTLGYEDVDANGQDDGSDSGMPSVQANLILETKLLGDKPTKFSLSGQYGVETTDTVVSNAVTEVDSKDYDSWLAMASVYVPLSAKVAVQGAYWQGANLDAYEAGILQGVNFAKDTEIEAEGGWGQIMFNPAGKVNVNIGYGIDDPDDKDLEGYPKGTPKLSNEYYMGNVYYRVNDAMVFAFEYSHLTTEYPTQDAENDRFHGAMYYYF